MIPRCLRRGDSIIQEEDEPCYHAFKLVLILVLIIIFLHLFTVRINLL